MLSPKRFILVYTLIFSLNTFAEKYQYPFSFNLQSKPAKISNRDFSRYIKPQLRNIFRDYESIFQVFSQREMGTIFQIQLYFSEILSSLSAAKEDCANLNGENCFALIEKIYRIGIKIEEFLLNVPLKLTMTTEVWENQKAFGHIELLNLIYNFTNDYYKLVRKLEDQMLSLQVSGKGPFESAYQIYDQFLRLNRRFHYIPLTFIDKKLQEDFTLVQELFFFPLWERAFIQDNKLYLLTNIERLNKIFNNWNYKISKGQFNLGKKAQSQLNGLTQTIHRRWNSILKIILK